MQHRRFRLTIAVVQESQLGTIGRRRRSPFEALKNCRGPRSRANLMKAPTKPRSPPLPGSRVSLSSPSIPLTFVQDLSTTTIADRRTFASVQIKSNADAPVDGLNSDRSMGTPHQSLHRVIHRSLSDRRRCRGNSSIREMEQTHEEIGIKIYNASPLEEPVLSLYPSSPHPNEEAVEAEADVAVPVPGHRRKRAVAKGMQKTLSKTSMLVNFLPTGTLLTFEMLLPSVYGHGQCSPVTTLMILVLLGLCTLSCFFFHFTDSFRGPDGKVYYGFVTPKGLAVFKSGLGVDLPKDERYKLGFTDFVHAIMSVMVFMAIAFSDLRVTGCLFPGHVKEMDEVMESFPLMVGIICSGLFLVFPNTRYGIGCMASS